MLVVIPFLRSLALIQEQIAVRDLHIFGNTSISGYCAINYAAVYQLSKSNQGLEVSKSRPSEKDITIPLLELIIMHITINLAASVTEAVKGYSIQSASEWTDCTVSYIC